MWWTNTLVKGKRKEKKMEEIKDCLSTMTFCFSEITCATPASYVHCNHLLEVDALKLITLDTCPNLLYGEHPCPIYH